MKKTILVHFLIPTVFLLSSVLLFGQKYIKTVGGSIQKAKVSFKSMQEYDKLHPAKSHKNKRPNKETIFPEFISGEKHILYLDKDRKQSQYQGIADDSPLPDLDFLGLEDNNNSIPPDVNGAAGPDHLMVTLNTGFRIMDKQGNVISDIGSGSFWYPLIGNGDTFDPKIKYDPYEKRWIIVMPSSSNVNSSKLFVGVSENTDPTGNWFLYSFDSDPNDQYWFDYPNYGFNKKWIAVSGNMFGAGFGYSVLFVINKADLYEGQPEVQYSRFAIYDGFTIVPAETFDNNAEDMYMISNAGGNSGGYGYLNLWKISGDIGNETVDNLGLTGIPEPWSNWSGAFGGNLAPQLGSDQRINSGDGRIQNAVYRHGKLWCAHHIFLPAENPDHSAIQWWELSTDGTILQRGRIEDTSGYYHFTFPTIAVNSKEDIMIGYGSFSPEQYAASSYSFRFADDPPNTLRTRYQFKDGLAPYYKTYGGDRNRWGDYTATCVDPNDDLDFWTLQEYAELPGGGYDSWGTWWAYIDLDAVPSPDFEANITSVPTGTSVNFTDLTKYAPEQWLWIFEGGTPSTSTEQNPQNIVYQNTGLYDVTLIASNYLGSDTLTLENYINSNTTILPEVNFTVNDTIPRTTDTVYFNDLSVYNPVIWQWEFNPGTVNFINGTSPASQNPAVIFTSPGIYTVTLTATNPNGSNSLQKEEYVFSGGVPMPFLEDFETKSLNDKSWLVNNPDNDKTWELAHTEGTFPGDKAANIEFRYYGNFGERDELVSPLINMTTFQSAFLKFDYAYAQRMAQYTDSLIVYISDDYPASKTRILTLGQDTTGNFATVPPVMSEFIPASESDWCEGSDFVECKTVDLSEWSGKPDIRVIFESYNGFGNNLFIDNVSIASPEAVDETISESPNITIFPNPANGKFTVMVKTGIQINNIKVINLTGQIIYNLNISSASSVLKFKIDLGSQPKGIYLVKITGNNISMTDKLILK